MVNSQHVSGLRKFIAVVFASSVVFLVIMGIYFIWKEREADKYKRILRNPYRVMGVITKKRSHKGKGMDVEYSANGKQFKYKTAIDDRIYNNYQVGDTISLTICKDDPSLALLTWQLRKEKVERFLGDESGKHQNAGK